MALINLSIEADSPEEFHHVLQGLALGGPMYDPRQPGEVIEATDPLPAFQVNYVGKVEQPAAEPAPAPTRGRGRPRKDAQAAVAEPRAIPASAAGTEAGTPSTGDATTDPFSGPASEPEPIVDHTKDDVQKVMLQLMDKGASSNQLNEILMKATGAPNVGAMDPAKYNDAYRALNDVLLTLG